MRLVRLQGEERENVKLSLKDMTEKFSTAMVTKEQETAKRVDMQEQNKELRITIDKLRSQVKKIHGMISLSAVCMFCEY